MAVTQPIVKLEPPDFAWQQIKIIPTDDDNDNNNDNDDDDSNNNNNNDKNYKSFVVSSLIPRWNRKIKEIQNLTMTTTSIMMTVKRKA